MSRLNPIQFGNFIPTEPLNKDYPTYGDEYPPPNNRQPGLAGTGHYIGRVPATHRARRAIAGSRAMSVLPQRP